MNLQNDEDKYFATQATQKQQVYFDEKDFFSQWMFSPDIKEVADYAHLDKNLAITKLSSRYKEPDRARALLRALHVLNNPKYFNKQEEDVLVAYDKKQIRIFACDQCGQVYHTDLEVETVDCGCKGEDEIIIIKDSKLGIINIPVYEKKRVLKSKYLKTFHSLKSAFYSLTTTAAARDGHLLKAATTTHFSRAESIEDKTQAKQKFSFGGNKKNNQGGY